MAQFSKALLSSKTSECRRLAEHIASGAEAMGLCADVFASRQSASHYVRVSESSDSEDFLKIRCSDRNDRHGGSDWYTWNGECPSHTIARLAERFQRPVPDGYGAEDYRARSDSARRAGAVRSQNRQANEREMTDSVAARLSTEKSVGHVCAGRLVDRLYPDIPRTQRNRIALDASAVVVRDRAMEAAFGNEFALLQLATRYPQAKEALFDLVGAERFAGMRPKGYPRAHWEDGMVRDSEDSEQVGFKP